MTIIWELNFIAAIDGEQKVMFTRAYENGEVKQVELSDQKIIFLNYVSLFPSKDIVRIKLGTGGQYAYSFYYFDKTYFKQGFLGVFGVSEFNTNEVYDWNETEFIAKYVFQEYYKRLEDGRIITPEGSQEYLNWVDTVIQENYQEFTKARDAHYRYKTQKTQSDLFAAFSDIAAQSEAKRDSESFWSRRAVKEAAMNKLREINMAESQRAYEYEKLAQNDKHWLDLQRIWDFQLINQFGNPMTKVMSFINGEHREWGSEEEQNMQSLMGMSYSVLKSFVEQQKLNLRNMKGRRENGVEYLLFQTVVIGNISYLIIMTVANFDPKSNTYVDLLKGDEEEVLHKIAEELIAKKDEFFDEKGEFKTRKMDFEIESLFYRQCKAQFRRFVNPF